MTTSVFGKSKVNPETLPHNLAFLSYQYPRMVGTPVSHATEGLRQERF
jgi:hypothetical protein